MNTENLVNKTIAPSPRPVRRAIVMAGAAIWLLASPASGWSQTLAIESEGNIFAPGTNNLWAVSPHAATIAQTTDGVIVAAWWAGEAERMPGNDVWMSRFINGSWTTPYKAADGDEIEKDYTVENPTLFQPVGGPLMLFYYAGLPKRKDVDKYGRQMWGFIKTSTDDGVTWSAARTLGNDARIEGGKLIGPTKNPPIQLEDGSILIPSNNEPALLSGGMGENIWAKSHKWHFEKSTNMGKTWFVVTILPENREFNAIQPGFLRLGGGKLLALGRNEGKGPETPCASSSDNGQTWSGITGLPALKQTDAGICPRTLSDGSHICILNPTNDWRNRLDLMRSTDGGSWKLELILNSSEDGYMAHYPQAVQTADGKLHVVFSYGKQNQPNTSTIRHVIVKTGLPTASAGTPPAEKAPSSSGRLVGHWGERDARWQDGAVDVPDLLDPALGNTDKDDGVFVDRKPGPGRQRPRPGRRSVAAQETISHGEGEMRTERRSCMKSRRKPGEWQPYDITLEQPRFDANGKLIRSPWSTTASWSRTTSNSPVERLTACSACRITAIPSATAISGSAN